MSIIKKLADQDYVVEKVTEIVTSNPDLKGEKGDSGVYVGTEEPTDETVTVWINPEGDADSDVITTVDEVNALIDERLEAIENGTY